jgi:hypothetical protein
MNCDCAFHIGSTHLVCQDYARAHCGKELSYIILSDGCSSSYDSDFGARLLTIGARSALYTGVEVKSSAYFNTAISFALGHRLSLGLAKESLDATLLVAAMRHNRKDTPWLEIAMMGDGAIIIKYRNGVLVAHIVDYETGYPWFANYLTDQDRKASWYKRLAINWQSQNKITGYPVITTIVISPDGGCSVFSSKETKSYDNLSPEQKLAYHYHSYCNSTLEMVEMQLDALRKEEIEFIALASDGLQSFYTVKEETTSKRMVPLAAADVIKELFCFKNYKGIFVKRRLHKFLKDIYKKQWQHQDDVSLAVIYLD